MTDEKRCSQTEGRPQQESGGAGPPGGDKRYSGRQRDDKEQVAKPDVVIDLSDVRAEGLKLSVGELDASFSLKLNLGHLLDVSVGFNAHLENAELQMDQVGTEAQLRASLARAQQILETAFGSILEEPEVFRDALGGVAEQLLRQAREAEGMASDGSSHASHARQRH